MQSFEIKHAYRFMSAHAPSPSDRQTALHTHCSRLIITVNETSELRVVVEQINTINYKRLSKRKTTTTLDSVAKRQQGRGRRYSVIIRISDAAAASSGNTSR